jgi:hypothetical protein
MKLISKFNDQTFEIINDLPEVGFYLYIYDRQNKCTDDYLQDTLEAIKEFAFEKYSVPLNSWTINNK